MLDCNGPTDNDKNLLPSREQQRRWHEDGKILNLVVEIDVVLSTAFEETQASLSILWHYNE